MIKDDNDMKRTLKDLELFVYGERLREKKKLGQNQGEDEVGG